MAVDAQVQMAGAELWADVGVAEFGIGHKGVAACGGRCSEDGVGSHGLAGEASDGSECVHSLCFVNRFMMNRPARLMASTMSVSTTAAT